jgi:cytochrome P450
MLAFGDSPASLLVPPAGSRTQSWLQRLGPFARFLKAREEADELLFTLIDERRSEASQRDDVLAMLLQARHEADDAPMSREEVRDELLTLLVAGHETTASTLAWCADILAHRQDVVARLRADDDPGAGEEYLTAVIHETLRCRPVLPNAAPRVVVEPIEVGGTRYPAGVCLVPCAYLVHHDPDLYPDPYAFRPERFVGVKPGTYTWIPFGGGRRRCLGSAFAMLEMRIVLRTLLRDRDLVATADEPELARRRNITIRPAGGCRVRLPERQRQPLPVAAEV